MISCPQCGKVPRCATKYAARRSLSRHMRVAHGVDVVDPVPSYVVETEGRSILSRVARGLPAFAEPAPLGTRIFRKRLLGSLYFGGYLARRPHGPALTAKGREALQ